MRTMFLAVTLAVLSVIYWPANTAIAQETRSLAVPCRR